MLFSPITENEPSVSCYAFSYLLQQCGCLLLWCLGNEPPDWKVHLFTVTPLYCLPKLSVYFTATKYEVSVSIMVTCRRTAAEGRGRGYGWGNWGGEVSTGVARRSGNTAARQTACQRQRQLGLHLLLQSLVLSSCCICHEPVVRDEKLVRVWKLFIKAGSVIDLS